MLINFGVAPSIDGIIQGTNITKLCVDDFFRSHAQQGVASGLEGADATLVG